MIHVQSFTFNPFQENTYILYNDSFEAIFIDPGMYTSDECNRIDEFIQAKKLKPVSIINTHTHVDHVFGIPYLVRKYSLPLYFHQEDLPVYHSFPHVANMYGLKSEAMPTSFSFLTEKDKVQLGEDEFSVLFTPGHSPGSICLYNKANNLLMSGDVLFQQSIGRTDLPGGNYDTLMNSIHNKIMTLPNETLVHSGHGLVTSVGIERMNNPFLIQ